MTVEERAARIAARRVEALAGRLAAVLGGVPGARIEQDGDTVRVSARGLARRLIDETRLRAPEAFL